MLKKVKMMKDSGCARLSTQDSNVVLSGRAGKGSAALTSRARRHHSGASHDGDVPLIGAAETAAAGQNVCGDRSLNG